jgi:hypothetical protein
MELEGKVTRPLRDYGPHDDGKANTHRTKHANYDKQDMGQMISGKPSYRVQ